MKKCLSCNIEVGGSRETCPLCQNLLTGEGTENNWPTLEKLKKQAFLYKLQLFIVLALAVTGLSLDYLMELNAGKHWSLIVTFAAVTVEIVLRDFMKKSVIVARIINLSVLALTMILVVASWYFGFLSPIAKYVIPIIIGATLITNLVFALIDTTENAMVYLLCNILLGICSYVGIELSHHTRTLPWTICLMISVITLIGIIVFKGRKVMTEIEKRMNI